MIRLTAKLTATTIQAARVILEAAMATAGVTGTISDDLSVHKNNRGDGLWVGAVIEDPSGDQVQHLALATEVKAKGVNVMFGVTNAQGMLSIPLHYPWVGSVQSLRMSA